MSFGRALNELKEHRAICMYRKIWGADVKVVIHSPVSDITTEFLVVESRKGIVPWIPNMIELLSEDWVIE